MFNFSGTFGPNSEIQQGLICDFELSGSLRLFFLREENPAPPQVPPVPTETRRSYRYRSYVLCLLKPHAYGGTKTHLGVTGQAKEMLLHLKALNLEDCNDFIKGRH